MKPVDNLKRPLIDVAKVTGGLETNQYSGSNQFSGISNIVSGSASVVVSTTLIKSASLVLLTPQRTDVATHLFLNFSVGSIVDGSRFTIKAQQATVNTQPVGWVIFNQLTN